MKKHRVCPHKDQPHRVMWWPSDLNLQHEPPVPQWWTLDNHRDARQIFSRLKRNGQAEWIRVYRADNEFYECLAWRLGQGLALEAGSS